MFFCVFYKEKNTRIFCYVLLARLTKSVCFVCKKTHRFLSAHNLCVLFAKNTRVLDCLETHVYLVDRSLFLKSSLITPIPVARQNNTVMPTGVA
jgi:hypothetical protein